mgnify:CR=1 FL=1
MSSNQPQKQNDPANDIIEKGKEILEQGNIRRVVIRKEDGDTLFEVSLTVAVIAVLVLLLIGPLGVMITLGGIFYGIVTKVRIEVVRELTDGDTIVELDTGRKNTDDEQQ